MNNYRKINKVLLIYPPTPIPIGGTKMCVPPLGISYIASFIREHVNVSILDASIEGLNHNERTSNDFFTFGLPLNKIRENIIKYEPDLIGISCLFSAQFPAVAKIAKMIKSINSDITTVIGGTHPTFLPEESLNTGNIDFIVSGEGEYTFLDLILTINKNNTLSKVNGIIYIDNGKIRKNQPRTLLNDLDKLPLPARDLLSMEKYHKAIPFGIFARKKRTTTIMTSRGCSGKCIFCSSHKYWQDTFRIRSAESVLDEIEHLISKYKIKQIQFIDDNLLLDKKRAKDIFNGMIKRNFNIQWNTPNGVAIWTLDEEIIELMKESGCYELILPFESGDPEILKKVIKKPLDLEHAKKMTNLIKNAGINTYAYTMIGFPGETIQQMQNTYDFIKDTRVDSAVFFIANPLPGTELYELCKKKGYLKSNFSFDRIGWSMSHIETPDFTSREVTKLAAKWNFSYNLGLLKRNPYKFFKRYGNFILSQPIQIKDTIIKRLLFNL